MKHIFAIMITAIFLFYSSYAIALNPKDAEAYYNRGTAYVKQGQYDKAIEDYNRAIKINPKDAKAYNNGHETNGETNWSELGSGLVSCILKINMLK